MNVPVERVVREVVWVRVAAAVTVLAGGALHAHLAADAYGTHDLVTLFYVNAIASAVVGAWLVFDERPWPVVAGLGVTASSLLAFGLSRTGDGVVGFRGVGLDPSPDAALVLVAEGVSMVLLLVALVGARAALVSTWHRARSGR